MTEDIPEEDLSHLNFLKDKYKIIEKIGEGTFSFVYRAKDTRNNSNVAVKAITRTSAPNRVLDELKFLQDLKGINNCIPLVGVYRNEDQIVAVFPYFEFTDFRELLSTITLVDIKFYMYNLLVSIAHTHSVGIIHRDLKPGNFLYNKKTGRGLLIDFGLAQYDAKYDMKKINEEKIINQKPILFFNSIVSRTKPPGYYERDTRPQMKAPRAGTRGFRAPEVIFRYPYQTKAIDVWSAGVMFLTLVCVQYPFFYSADDVDGLVEIATIFGHKEMRKAAKHYGRDWKSNIDSIPEERIPFETLVSKLNQWMELSTEGYDLMYRMLDLIADTRITADQALLHPFFDSIKK
ncbi:Cell cycle serine/threonine-protein kinase hsk1 [Nosema bombycis CQ1]|uniref:non-specific serine/threonine protein kinase n=1 Tax=Nosema bombycis (strain CQ1 / CVCC 102059) TaxID=578461 RepID=R0MBZ6_NOSB1|nr:Cell cycle serine/threonine-protein kinase hsk1 [Nosema bombycis CQ1]|eukprot:EOB15479.1 Cell cycle serine/threonine-protein kinase hsk1 [Nosema bombycis CQ1]